MPKCKRGLTTDDEIQKVLADLEEIFDDSDSDCESENEEDDLISAQQKSDQIGCLRLPVRVVPKVSGPMSRQLRTPAITHRNLHQLEQSPVDMCKGPWIFEIIFIPVRPSA
ncbi:hypothetical protein TNCV_2326601 [Trichonephila clavipes]|nr:hypothetical protein TNCV_2326601 [Trichonephila clavipes]